jgi:hypothetical protein
MITWFRNLFNPKQEVVILPEQVDHPDDMMREAIARCFNTGNMVIGNRDEHGNVTITEHKRK